MNKHQVRWEEHNGKTGAKSFAIGVSRGKVEAFRRKKGAEAKVKNAWIVWASLPRH